MVQKKTLEHSEIKTVLLNAQLEQTPTIGSYKINGKWQLLELIVCGHSEDSVNFCSKTPCEQLKQEQPIGIYIHLGHFKYLFDSSVQNVEQQGMLWHISLDFPEKVERIERRAYHRQAIPNNTKVKVLFWHRGYLDESDIIPAENYWQGTLLNLSAGGARFEIDIEQKEHFKVGQILGIQFTPMSYQKPLLLESHVKYAEDQSDHQHFRIGVEFLGLEASPEGRQILDRILEVINFYKEMAGSETVRS